MRPIHVILYIPLLKKLIESPFTLQKWGRYYIWSLSVSYKTLLHHRLPLPFRIYHIYLFIEFFNEEDFFEHE